MKFLVDRDVFFKALSRIQSVIERRPPIPILSHILLTSQGSDRLILRATDLDMSLTVDIPAQITQEGSLTLSGHLLCDVVKRLPSHQDATLAQDSNGQDARASLTCGSSQFNLGTLPVDTFPLPPADPSDASFELSSGLLRRLLDQTRFAMATSQARHNLSGIYIHHHEGDLRFVATDAHRLALAWAANQETQGNFPSLILPRKAVQEIRKILNDDDNPVHVALSEKRAAFRLSGCTLSTALIQGTFPGYIKAIPERDEAYPLTVSVAELTPVIGRVALVADDKVPTIQIQGSADSPVIISAETSEFGKAREELPVRYDGPDFSLSLNAQYLLDVAEQIRTPHLVIWLKNDPMAPLLICEETKNDEALFVLMPMRG